MFATTNSNPGVYWNGVGNNYSHNRVSNSPHVCFLGGGNEGQPFGGDNVESGAGSQCVFDSNTLDSCVYECADCGAFYTSGVDGMAWVNRGNVLTNSQNNWLLRKAVLADHSFPNPALVCPSEASLRCAPRATSTPRTWPRRPL